MFMLGIGSSSETFDCFLIWNASAPSTALGQKFAPILLGTELGSESHQLCRKMALACTWVSSSVWTFVYDCFVQKLAIIRMNSNSQ